MFGRPSHWSWQFQERRPQLQCKIWTLHVHTICASWQRTDWGWVTPVRWFRSQLRRKVSINSCSSRRHSFLFTRNKIFCFTLCRETFDNSWLFPNILICLLCTHIITLLFPAAGPTENTQKYYENYTVPSPVSIVAMVVKVIGIYYGMGFDLTWILILNMFLNTQVNFSFLIWMLPHL